MSNINPSKIGNSENTFALVDSRYPNRWLDAWGDVDKDIIDTYRVADWIVTATGTSPVATSLVPDAKILITTQNVDFAGDNMQRLGSRFKLEAGKPVYFGAKLTVSNATQCDLLVGLCGVDTTLTAASSTHALDIGAGGVFFSKLDEVATGYFKSFATTTETNSAVALTLDTAAHWYEMVYDGSKLSGYIDGSLIGTFSASLPTVVLTPSICFRAGTTTAVTCTIHEMRTIAVRG
jgi:hypothetical protein